MNFCQRLETGRQRNMKTSQSPSHGLAKFSRLHQTSKNIDAYASSSKNTEQPSKYFTIKTGSKEEDEDDMSTSELSESLDSPYKNSLTYIKYVPPVDDASDFKTPKPIKKVSKIFKPSGVSLNTQKIKKSRSKKSMKNKNLILKISKDNFGLTDINPDHLQMALALSKSTYQLENPQMPKDTEEDLPSLSPRQKIAKVKTTLEKYGFKSDKSKIQPERKRDIEISKRHKNSRFRFVTPILKMRTPEEREAIVTSKISLLMNQNSEPPTKESLNEHNENEVFSDILKEYYKGSIIFRVNRLRLEQTDDLDYYSKCLNITPIKYQCGHLLKKWEEIPGRDKSPVRKLVPPAKEYHVCENLSSKSKETVNIDCQKLSTKEENKSYEINTASITLCNKKTELAINLSGDNTPDRNCISPDLFESEDETDFALKTPETDNVLSQSLLNLSPSKSQGLLRPSKSKTDSSQSESFQKRKLVLSKKNIFKNNQGIEHFESYDNDFNQLSQEICDLKSSEDESTEDLYLNSVKNKETVVSRNLTQRSLSNKITDDEQPIVYDLTLSSSSDEATSDQFEFMENFENKQTEDLTDNVKEKCSALINLRQTESNFDMSPLHIKDSNEFVQRPNTKLSPQQGELNFGNVDVAVKSPCEVYNRSPLSSRNGRTDFQIDELNFNSTTMLNVTDYITQILSKDDEGTTENADEYVDVKNYNTNKMSCDVSEKSLNRYSKMDCSNRVIRGKNFVDGNNCILDNHREDLSTSQDNDINLSQQSLSQESIVISDEELNYSSVYSTSKKNDKYFYNLSETEEIEQNKIDDHVDIKEVGDVHSVLKAKYEDQCISEPVHNRITELKQTSLSLTRKSLVKVCLEDSFNDLLEDTNILETIESAANTDRIKKNRGPTDELTDKIIKHVNITPEKFNISIMPSTAKSDTTPENNLIIKTTDVTPIANYDEMDTPKITKELQQFGLKPLKRQRGVKLLKYLYECTHPMVGPKEIEGLSSDEDDRRKIKKRKKFDIPDNETDFTPLEQDNCTQDEDTVDIVGDLLLENENLEDLIFERKYSVKIPSCRIPLQIVWHNFVSKNLDIRENILLYEPLQLEVLHSLLKEQSGCKFHIQDLLTFFDRKCITIRTAQAQRKRTTRK